MKSDTEILKEMLREDALTHIVPKQNGRTTLKLKEHGGTGHRGYYATIRNIPQDAIAIKVDKFPAPSEFYRGGKGENKRADYIIISEQNKNILYIELKKKKGKRSDIISQLKGATCVLSHCREVAKQYWGKDYFLDKYQQKYIVVYVEKIKKTRIQAKRPTSISNGSYNSPDNFLRIGSDTIWY